MVVSRRSFGVLPVNAFLIITSATVKETARTAATKCTANHQDANQMSFLVATEDVCLTYTDAMGTMTVAITAMKNAIRFWTTF